MAVSREYGTVKEWFPREHGPFAKTACCLHRFSANQGHKPWLSFREKERPLIVIARPVVQNPQQTFTRWECIRFFTIVREFS